MKKCEEDIFDYLERLWLSFPVDQSYFFCDAPAEKLGKRPPYRRYTRNVLHLSPVRCDEKRFLRATIFCTDGEYANVHRFGKCPYGMR